MPTFKTKELEQLSQNILTRAVSQQEPLREQSLVGRIRRAGLRQKLPRLLRRRL